ncbi:AAA family ATPase [Megasphaera sp. WILCCON 0056]|uniref:AAA family ATPase n=1 Tax=Megasphaera sp. WILCCON 0056 TaxID=3345340 RepID=UPI003A8063D3
MNQHFITKIHIDKVRHLQNITIPLSETTCKHLILTGKNGSGKTSVMEALKAYLSIYTSDSNTSDDFRRSKNLILDLQSKIESLQPSDSQYRELSETLKRTQYFLSEYDKGVTVQFNDEDGMRAKVYTGEYIFAYYKAERGYTAHNEKNVSKVDLKERYTIQEHPGQEFVKYILNLKTVGAMAEVGGKKERAEEIKKWFQRFDHVLQIIFDAPQAHLDFDIESFEFHIIVPGREPFTFDTLSSGYAAVLDIVVDLMMRMEKKAGKCYDLEGVVLIDEIEAHLHLELQKKIMPILTGIFTNIQFIVTTHSPFILNSIENTVIYDLANHMLVNTPEGLSNIPYDGIVEGYFKASAI